MTSRKFWTSVGCLLVLVSASIARAQHLEITHFEKPGQLVFDALDDGTNYIYRVEWAPSANGPWSTFGGAGSWLDQITVAQGSNVTSTVPMFYRVVAHLGDYMSIDLSGGPNAESYPVTYYRTLADIPGGPNNDFYKTNSLLMRRIPRGTFTMGSPPGELGRFDAREAQRQVTLTKDFYIGVFQVTQRQWEQVMGDDWPSHFENEDYRDARPLEDRSWNDIRGGTWPGGTAASGTFIERISSRTGLAFDLPTEAQWEYACRAGTTTSLNAGKNLTNTGSCPNMSEVGRYYHNHPGGYSSSATVSTAGGTAKVGSYLPNAWGLYDMHGNVWEWCLDWYVEDAPGSVDPVGAATGSSRVVRGGSWYNDAWHCRSAYRVFITPSSRNYGVGFRLSKTLP